MASFGGIERGSVPFVRHEEHDPYSLNLNKTIDGATDRKGFEAGGNETTKLEGGGIGQQALKTGGEGAATTGNKTVENEGEAGAKIRNETVEGEGGAISGNQTIENEGEVENHSS